MSGFGPVPLGVPVVLSREEARRLAEQELQKAKYGGLPPWVQHALDRVSALLRWLTELYQRSGGPQGGFSPVVVVVALLLVAAVVVIIWRVGLPRLRHRRVAEEEVAVDSDRTPLSYRDQAAARAAAGDFRAAIGDRFRAVVRELEELTVLDVRPARTAGEVVRTAGLQLPEQLEALGELALIFDAAWYGDRPPGAEDYDRACRLDALISEAARHADLATGSATGVGSGVGTGGTSGAVR